MICMQSGFFQDAVLPYMHTCCALIYTNGQNQIVPLLVKPNWKPSAVVPCGTSCHYGEIRQHSSLIRHIEVLQNCLMSICKRRFWKQLQSCPPPQHTLLSREFKDWEGKKSSDPAFGFLLLMEFFVTQLYDQKSIPLLEWYRFLKNLVSTDVSSKGFFHHLISKKQNDSNDVGRPYCTQSWMHPGFTVIQTVINSC